MFKYCAILFCFGFISQPYGAVEMKKEADKANERTDSLLKRLK
jgi:hypothetical protein